MKLSTVQCGKVTRYAVAYMIQALERDGHFDFAALREAILAQWPGAEFNWLTVVRNPMQSLINDGVMVRDTANIRGPERYVRVAPC